MSQNNAFPTYIKELDQKILQSLDDYNLLISCQTNSHLASICEDDMFWKERVIQRYNKLVVFYDPDMSWNYFYNKLINDAMYIVHTNIVYMDGVKVKIYDNIRKAYDYLNKRGISGPKIATITLLFKGEVISDYSSRKIFDYYNPIADILDYPDLRALKVKNKDLIYYEAVRYTNYPIDNTKYYRKDETNNSKFFGVFDYNDNTLHSLLFYDPIYYVPYDHFYSSRYIILSLNNSTKKYQQYWKTKYGYKRRHDTVKNRQVLILMLDESLFGKPLRFIKYMLPVDEYDARPADYAREHIISLYKKDKIYEYYDEDKLGDKEDNGEIFRKYRNYGELRVDNKIF